jgi:hypothetical protein
VAQHRWLEDPRSTRHLSGSFTVSRIERGGGVTERGKSSLGTVALPVVVATVVMEKASVRVLHMGKEVEGS